MGLVGEFREFIARGNVVDLAVGVIIGAAFTKIVDAVVKDVLMPPLGLATGGADFSDLKWRIGQSVVDGEIQPVTINYGNFVNAIIQFLLVALVLFLFIRQYNRLRRRNESVPVAPTDKECPFCRFKIPLAATRCAHCTSELSAAA